MDRECAAGLERLGPDYYATIRTEFQRKRDPLCDTLEESGLKPYRPQGSYFVLADVERVPGRTGTERAMWLLCEIGVACVPGEAFFDGPERHRSARFCFGKTDEDLDEACRRIRNLSL